MKQVLDDRIAEPVVLATSLAADRMFLQWLEQNAYAVIKDGDGSQWRVHIREEPTKQNSESHLFETTLCMELEWQASAEALFECGILEMPEDERILTMVANEVITMHLKPRYIRAESLAAARSKLSEILPKTKETLRTQSYKTMKRQLVVEWVKGQRVFGAPVRG